ncbi:VWA-like domain-containing protein [Pseudofrankia sp. DC12]|uniref:vWA domain-containing protein n=1 Tax=Pseudofrankia sp. DC12 TaxID=683315 RepID=UPI0005F7AAC5|nr:VWA-like domain-containing protein [Pseudofrankia sp. DC12]
MSALTGPDRTKIAAARIWAVARQPYLARALFACSVVAAPASGTIAVDRNWRLCVDPDLLAGFDPTELGRLFLHLTGHLIRDHAARAEANGVTEDEGRARWNRSADAEINDDLEVDGCRPRAAPDLPGDLDAPAGQLTEAYYRVAVPGPRHWDCGAGADARPAERGGGIETGDHTADGPPGGLSRAQGDLLRLGVAADIHRQYATDPGTVAGGWLRWAEAMLPSRVDWRRVLAAEIRAAISVAAGAVDYSYRHPSRRARAAPGVVLPTMRRPVPEVAIVCDTSGSMHEGLLAQALAEIDGILSRAGLRGGGVRVLAVDTTVPTLRRVSQAGQVRLAGGGGTDMGAGIAAAARLRPRPSTIIVLTDGYTPWPEQPPPGVRVVIGLLREPGLGTTGPNPPGWARTVVIEATH